MVRELLLDRTKILETKENKHVAAAIDHTIDVLPRLVVHQSSRPVSQPKNQERCKNGIILEVRPSKFHGESNLEIVRLI